APPASITAGNSNVSVTGSHTNYVISSAPTLSLTAPNTLSISHGNSVALPTVGVAGGTNVTIGGAYPNYVIHAQPTLDLVGNQLSISGGNSILIPTAGTIAAVTTSVVTGGIVTHSVLGANSFSIY